MDTQQSTTLPTKENATDSTKPLIKLTPLEVSLQSQNANYKNQIKILEEKVSYYENEHFTRTSTLTAKLKSITKNESKLHKELLQTNIKLSNFEKENKYLKAQLSEMEQNVLCFKKEVKDLYKQIQSPPIKEVSTTANSEYDTRLSEMISLLKQYSNEISKLKSENNNLNQTLANYIHNPPTPREKLIEDDGKVSEITSMINNEIIFISQWIDTYMSSNYDKNFDVPSLLEEQSETTSLCVNFDMLKASLENSRRRINEELNSQEKTIQDMKSMTSLAEVKNVQLKNEIGELRNKIYLKNENEYQLKEQIQSNAKQIKAQNEKIDSLCSSIETMKKEYTSYLGNLYQEISQEISNIIHDSTFKAFHDNIIDTSSAKGSSAKSIELLLSSSVDKLLQFVGELKFDYTKTKNENIKFLTDSIGGQVDSSENVNLIGKELATANSRIRELEEMITKVNSENALMRNQIEFIEQNNKVKQKNEGDLKKKYDEMAKKVSEYELIVKEKENEIEIMKEKNRMMSEKGERDKKMIEELKEKEERGLKLEIENEKIKKDYNRLIDENNILRKLNQNSIIKK